MSTLKFKRFTKPHFLKQIGRDTLGQFFNRFSPALAEKQITLPAATLDADAYYEAVARLAMSLDGLPEALVEAVHAIEGMANEEGEDRLERATGENGRAFEFRDDATTAEKAMHAWLTNPEQFAEIFNELRLTRLASYDYYSAKTPMDQTEMFAPPSAQAIELMTADMEAAFRAKNRGQRTCHIEVHWMDGEYWLRIQHGDTYTRVATLANGGIMSVLHFRPAKDDVVVLALHRDEIRIHAGTKWEKDLYRETVGHRLFGDPNYFSERKIYTLDPLRTEGADALDVSDLPGVSKIVLRKFELAWPGAFKDSVIRKSEDVFTSAEERKTLAIPESGQLIAAELDFYFGDNPKPRKVSLRPPNILKLGRHCDATLVHRWLMQNGFVTLNVNGAGQRTEGNITHVCVPHLPSSA
jgi:hypothetical protein